MGERGRGTLERCWRGRAAACWLTARVAGCWLNTRGAACISAIRLGRQVRAGISRSARRTPGRLPSRLQCGRRSWRRRTRSRSPSPRRLGFVTQMDERGSETERTFGSQNPPGGVSNQFPAPASPAPLKIGGRTRAVATRAVGEPERVATRACRDPSVSRPERVATRALLASGDPARHSSTVEL